MVVLLGVLGGVVFPRLRGSVRAAGLDEAAHRTAALVRVARTEAMRRGLKVRLKLDSRRGTVSLLLQDPDGANDYAEFGDQLLDATHSLPGNVSILRVTRGELQVRDDVIDFSPGGVSDQYSIELSDESGRVSIIEIGAWVDEVAVVRRKEPRF